MKQYYQNLFSIDYQQNEDFFAQILYGQSLNNNQSHQPIPYLKNQNQMEYSNQNLNKASSNLNTKQFETNQEEIGIQTRKIAQIDFSSILRSKIKDIIQGRKDDTVDLNVNFKTIIVNIFKELMILNELTRQQAKQVQEFMQRPPSFKSLYMFCWCGSPESTIREKLTCLIQSKKIMKKILSNRSCLSTKLQMIKLVEVLRRNVTRQKGITKWKQLSQK